VSWAGFTLVELLVALTVLGLLYGIGAQAIVLHRRPPGQAGAAPYSAGDLTAALRGGGPVRPGRITDPVVYLLLPDGRVLLSDGIGR